MVKKLLSAAKYRAYLRSVQGFNHGRRSMDVKNGGDCSKKLSAVKYRASLVRAMVEGSSKKNQKPTDQKRKMPNDLQKRGNEAMDDEEMRGEEVTPPCPIDAVERCEGLVGEKKRKRLDFMDSNCVLVGGVWGSTIADEMSGACSKRKVMLDQTVLQKKEVCGLAPIARCPQNVKMSESCIQKDGTKQDIHLGEGYEGLHERRLRKGVLDQRILPDTTDNQVPSQVEEDGGCLRAKVCEGLKECSMDVQPARMIDNAKPHMRARGQSIMSDQQELEGEITGIPHSQHSPSNHVFTKQQTTASEEANGPSNNEFVFTKQQSIDSEEANGSPNNEVVSTKQQVSDSEESNGSPSTDISRNITLVKTIYSERMEKLMTNHSKKSIQFRQARDRIEKESIAKLRVEHLHKSALVRKIHLGSQVRLVKLRAVDQEFVMKVETMKNHLNTEQEKLDSMHKAAREEEKELKYHWLQEAKSGRPVDAFSILPQFLNSCFNLDNLKHCEQVHLEELISDGPDSLSLREMGAAGPFEIVRDHSLLAEESVPTEPTYSMNLGFQFTDPLPCNQSNDDISAIPPDAPLQRHPPIVSSEPLGPLPLLSILSYNDCPVVSQANQLQMCTTANSRSEPLLFNSSNNDTSVLPHAMQVELPIPMDSLSVLVQSNESIPLDVQLQRPIVTNQPSEPGSGTRVSEMSLLGQRVKDENAVQFLKFDEELARICRVDGAQPLEFHDELKVRMQRINTDFEKDMEGRSQKYRKEMENIRQKCSELIHDAVAQKKKAIGTSSNRVTRSFRLHQGI